MRVRELARTRAFVRARACNSVDDLSPSTLAADPSVRSGPIIIIIITVDRVVSGKRRLAGITRHLHVRNVVYIRIYTRIQYSL